MLNMNKSLFSVLALGLSLALQAQSTTAEKSIVNIPKSEVRKPVFFEPDFSIGGATLNIRDEADFSGYEVLAKAIGDKRYVFTGEDHRPLSFNTLLEGKMMHYLRKEKGFEYYFVEAGFASTWLLNKYMLEGDSIAESAIKRLFSPEYYELFTNFRTTNLANDSLPKIQAYGLDIERDITLAMLVLVNLVPENKAIPDSMAMFIESARIFAGTREGQYDQFNAFRSDERDDPFDFSTNSGIFDDYGYFEEEYIDFSTRSTVALMLQNYELNKEVFHAFFSENLADFQRLMAEMKLWKQWIEYTDLRVPHMWALREGYMEKNLVQFAADHPSAKGFGQFGRCHVSQNQKAKDCGLGFFNSLNGRVARNHPELNAQLVSIGLYYDGLGDEFPESLVQLTRKNETSSAMLYTHIDSLNDEDLSAKFDMVIVAKSKRGGAASAGGGSQSSIGLGYSAVFHDIDLNAFNAATQFNITSPLLMHEFTYEVRLDGRVQIENSFGVFANLNASFVDTAGLSPDKQINRNMSLSGWSYRYGVGVDLVRSKYFDLVPTLALGYQRLSYREESISGQGSSFNSATVTEFTNPAFIVDGRIQMCLNFDWLTLKAIGGYTLDCSKTEWKLGDNRLSTGPKTRMSNPYFGAGVVLRFGMND
ncbi:MAG: hypothetical protein EP332_10990 [Bacteroidetes bacterium]|nr:MAG: hypothetical protein EP332_10990 [Bacteroidota bacterium]